MVGTCHMNGGLQNTSPGYTVGVERIQEEARTTKDKKRNLKNMNITWEEAEWRQRVAQCYQQDAGWTFFEITFWKYFTQWWGMRPHFISTVLISTKHYLLCYWLNSEILWGLVSLYANNGIILCLHYFILHFQNTFSKLFAQNCVNTYTNAVNGSQNKLT